MTSPDTYPTPSADSDSHKRLANMVASATQQYSLKNYDAAADFYSEATELQAIVNGEMSPENADLLYAYGRCLYHVAVSKSDVLGGKVAGEKGADKPKKRKAKEPAHGAASSAGMQGPAQPGEQPSDAVLETIAEKRDDAGQQKQEAGAETKPYFAITGDENWTDESDSEAEDGEDGAQQADEETGEEEDDFANAYEILDVARVLLTRKLEALVDEGKGKNKVSEVSAEVRQVKERLADTHDLQAEISLENERFADAITDSRSALALKQELYPKESSLLAEAHFKLSLALEFASVTKAQGEDGNEQTEVDATKVDQGLRDEAIQQMEAAIKSCRLRISKEQGELASLAATEAERKQRSINDVTEMVEEMEQRLLDLRNPEPVLNGAPGLDDAASGSNPLAGLLGSMLGASPAHQKARIEEATKGANDLTGLVKHKKKPAVEKDTSAVSGASITNGAGKDKRKLEFADEADQATEGKKVKFDDEQAA
ncbi:tetratricopeptide repeat protein [Cryomyces antarcticus]